MLMLSLLGVLTLLLGVFNSFISVPAQTALQERSPEQIRARVFSAFYTVSNAILIIPVVFAAALADTLGHVPTVIGIGVVVILVAGLGLYRSRGGRGRGQTEPLLDGHLTREEAEAALAAGAPAPRPLPRIPRREYEDEEPGAGRPLHARNEPGVGDQPSGHGRPQ